MDPNVLIDVVAGIALVVLIIAATLSVVKIAVSRKLEDRIVALDLLLAVVVAAVAAFSALTRQTAFLDVLVVGVLITFIGSILAARLLNTEVRR